MTVFCDSSALVKLYADEPGADAVRSLGALVVSALARVEVPGALWRKQRLGELSTEDAAALVEAFEWDWSRAEGDGAFIIVAVNDEVLEAAARCVARHALRSLDAVQLGSALTARLADAHVVEFACYDLPLAAAAAAEGFRAPA